MSDLLKPYTLDELAANAVAAPDLSKPTDRLVKFVQADLFNEQSVLFGHVPQLGELP